MLFREKPYKLWSYFLRPQVSGKIAENLRKSYKKPHKMTEKIYYNFDFSGFPFVILCGILMGCKLKSVTLQCCIYAVLFQFHVYQTPPESLRDHANLQGFIRKEGFRLWREHSSQRSFTERRSTVSEREWQTAMAARYWLVVEQRAESVWPTKSKKATEAVAFSYYSF